MLRIKSNPLKRVPKDATFESPASNQKKGIEMLIALNTTTRAVLTGPDVGVDSKILVTKDKPHFLFNPRIVSKNLHSDAKSYKLDIMYRTYAGEEAEISFIDCTSEIEQAIDNLNNGIKRAQKPKV